MKKYLFLAIIIVMSSNLKGQASVEQESFLTELASLIPSDNDGGVVVYPSPIIDQFRLDLRDYKNMSLKITIENGEHKVFFSTKLEDIKGNFLPLSAYGLGMTTGKYKVTVVTTLRTHTGWIKLL